MSESQNLVEKMTLHNFGQFIAACEQGGLQADLTRELSELIHALKEHGEGTSRKVKGSLGLKLDFAFDGEHFEVTGNFSSKKPEATRGRSIFWGTSEDKLTRVDPGQHDMFRDPSVARAAPVNVDSAPAEVRTV